MPHEAEALEPDEAEVPSIAEATEGEAEATEAEASRTTEAEVVEASSGAAEPSAQDAETEAGQALVQPPVQDPPPLQESTWEVEVQAISSDDTSRGKEVADAKAASTAERPVSTPTEGSSALMRVRPACLVAEPGQP